MRHGTKLALAAALLASSAEAKVAAIRTQTVHVPGGGGQLAMTLQVDGSSVVAATCAASPCDLRAAKPIAFPTTSTGPRLLTAPIRLERGRHAVIVRAMDEGQGGLVTLLAAPAASTPDHAPTVLFQGMADLEPGGHAPNVVELRSLPGNLQQVLVGERRDDIGLCGGRTALLAPRVLDPADLTLKPAKLMRLSDDERDKARRLIAEKRSGDRPAPLAHLLSASGASSAIGSPAALVDGDLETTWSESRGGDGRGEFVTLRASKDVPITSLSFVPRPKTRDVEGGAAPKKLYVATDDALFAITLPEDGWQHPGTRYDIRFPEPIATSCLAVVLDEAYVEASAKGSVHVTLAEVEARSAFDEGGDLKSLVATLNGGDKRARGAAAVLMRAGAPAFRAVLEGYSGLDDGGRMLALDVVDQAGCADASPLYARALGGSFDGEITHARTRLERCRRAAVPALLAALADPAHPARFAAADELSMIAPDEATVALAPLVIADDAKLRKKAREAFTRATGNERSAAALARVLEGSTLPPAARTRVLRIATSRLGDDAVRPAASRALAATGASFEERYLVLPAAAALATKGDEPATAMLRAALAEPRASLRAEAARVATDIPALAPRLAELAGDAEPRVREAVAGSLRGGAVANLASDEWPFVRVAAYESLARSPADPAIDALLVRRLGEDTSTVALTRAIDAASRRSISAASPALRAIASDEKRTVDLRSRALAALGGVCDRGAVDLLTDVARKGAAAMAKAEEQALAGAAIAALGRIHPTDLAARLSPISAEGASIAARSAARSAVEEKDVCR